MKSLLCLALLLVAVEAGAGEEPAQFWNWRISGVDGGIGFIIAGSDQEQLGRAIVSAAIAYPQIKRFAIDREYVQAHTPDCLATMEAAMRAMEPFLMESVPGLTLRGVDRLHGELWPKGAWDALEQWTAAKAQCWRTP
jgi:hypothetical protein